MIWQRRITGSRGFAKIYYVQKMKKSDCKCAKCGLDIKSEKNLVLFQEYKKHSERILPLHQNCIVK
jgi:hypothetical protein